MFLLRWPIVSSEVSSQTWMKASVSSWTVCGAPWQPWVMEPDCCPPLDLDRGIDRQICSISAFVMKKLVTHQSRNPGPAYSLTMGLSISSRYPRAFKLPLANTETAAQPSKEMPPSNSYKPTAKPVLLDDNAGSVTLYTVSADSRSCAQCGPTLVHEEHRAPTANLSILMFSCRCQSCVIDVVVVLLWCCFFFFGAQY